MKLTNDEVKLFTFALNNNFKYSIQYVDYRTNEWTAPARLTQDRYAEFMQDNSVRTIRLIADVKF